MSALIVTASADQGSYQSVHPALAKRTPAMKPSVTRVSPDAIASHVVVKFSDDSGIRFQNGRLTSARPINVPAINRVLGGYFTTQFRPLFDDASENRLNRARATYELLSKTQLADLTAYFAVEVSSPAEAEQLANELNKLDAVEIAYVQPSPEPAGDIDPPTPDYQPFQDYREAAPAGVDADYANAQPGGDGTGVKIIDIEGGWQTTHEDLDKAVGGIIGGSPIGDPAWKNHGTAVIGEMIAGDNGYGVTGICPGADIGMVSIGGQTTAEALYMAVEALQPGDVILVELHAPGPHYDFESRPDQLGYVCMEYWQANFDVIQYAWAKGITVIEAAGNGAEDFDDTTIYGPLFDTTYRNSHAIITGAGYPAASSFDLQRQGFSNYGERVNLQGYGSGVYTAGYGGLFNGGGDENQYYTATFAGTSSASPIVTGAVACLQGHYLATYGELLGADNIRDLLVSSGTPQLGDTSEHIGPRPDLQSAFGALTAPPSLVARPIYIDTTVTEGEVGTIDLWLVNRSLSQAFDFSVVDNDSLSRFVEDDWLIATPGVGTVAPNDSLRLDVQLDATVIEDRVESYKGVLEVSWGPSGEALEFLILVPVFLSIPCNDSTYLSVSSDEPGGPTYAWISAKEMGLKISNSAFHGIGLNPLDDGTAGPYAVGFDFHFFDTAYTHFYIGANGALSFTDTALNVNGFFSALDIPGAPFKTFLAPFWNDLIIDPAAVPEAGVYIYRNSKLDTCVIEWYRLSNFNDPGDTLTDFEIVLRKDRSILFQYRSVGASGLEQTALIGVSAAGCQAVNHYDDGDQPAHQVSGQEAVLLRNTTGEWLQSGDVTDPSGINVADLSFLVDYLFFEGPPPNPTQTGDVDCAEDVTVADLSYLVSYLFLQGPAPCYFWLSY